MLSHKMDFNCCANRDGFRIDSHISYSFPCISIVSNSTVNCLLMMLPSIRRLFAQLMLTYFNVTLQR